MKISTKVQKSLDDARFHLMGFAAVSGLAITIITATLLPANSYAETLNLPLPPGNLAEHPQANEAINCQKQWVSDGDTVNASCEGQGQKTRIRLYCIDAPETSQGEWGKAAGAHLEKMMDYRFKLIVQDTDRYGRLVGEVFNQDGRNLNVEMVGTGAASVYKSYCNESHYYDIEKFAKKNGFGIWKSDDPLIQSPWDYRKQQRTQSTNFNR